MDGPKAALTLAGLNPVDPGALARDLNQLSELLEKWQKVQNLIARTGRDEFWSRHIADSLQLASFIGPNGAQLLDFGSGGGFPALPLACYFKGRDIRFTLVESHARKVAFLRDAGRKLALNIKVVDSRIEDFVSRETSSPDFVTARALAPLVDLCGFSAPVWGQNTIGLFLKGREHVEELREAGAAFQFDVLLHQSKVEPDGVIVEMRNLSPKSR